jgi:hypothetical protein
MKLSDIQCGEMRAEHRIRQTSVAALARRYNVSWATANTAIHCDRVRRPRQARSTKATVLRRRKRVAAIAMQTLKRNEREYPAHCSANSIRIALHRERILVSKRTVIRDLHNLKFDCRVRKRVPTRDPKVIRNRLSFSRSWNRMRKKHDLVVFSDEHTVSINDHGKRTMWVAPEGCVIPRERRRLQNIPRIMVWAAVGVGFKSDLVLFPEVCRDDEGGYRSFRLNGDSYVRRCLSKVAAKLVSGGHIFQQDGAKPHQSGQARRYMQRMGMQVIDPWPAYSPDLNMCELMWPILNQNLSALKPDTLESLKDKALQAWKSIKQSEIDAVCSGFTSKVAETEQKRGEC